MRRARLIPIALCFASRLAAQWQATADFGISQLRQPGFADASALMAGASVDALSDRAQLRSRMLGARDGTGGWTAQGVVLGSLFGPPTAGVRWELTGIGA